MIDIDTIVTIGLPIVTLAIGYGIKALRDGGQLPAIQTKMEDVGILIECVNDVVKTFNESLKDGNIDGNEVEVIIGKLNALGGAIGKLLL